MSHKITFREYGEGPLVILLHGYGGSVLHWDPLVEKLKTNYHVVVPNLSHVFMSTDKLLFGSQVELVGQFISQIVAKQNEIQPESPQKAHLVGMSYGGSISWATSLKQPQIIESLCLINPMMPDPLQHFHRAEFRHYFRLPIPAKALALLLATPFGKKFLIKAAEVFREEKSSDRVRYHELQGRKLLFAAQMVSNFSWIIRTEDWGYWLKELAHLTVPTQLIFDCEDPLFNKQSYGELARRLRCQSVVELTGAGHLPVRSRPESIHQSLLQFFASLNENLTTQEIKKTENF